MKIFTQIGHDKKATQRPALLILEILFNVVLSNIKKGAQGSLFYYLLYQLYRLWPIGMFLKSIGDEAIKSKSHFKLGYRIITIISQSNLANIRWKRVL